MVTGFYGRLDPDSQRLDLDSQLDRAKLDPNSFLRHLAAITDLERNSTIAPLVVRSARRGDAQAVARQLRTTSHPLASTISARFDRQGRQRAAHPLVIPVSTR